MTAVIKLERIIIVRYPSEFGGVWDRVLFLIRLVAVLAALLALVSALRDFVPFPVIHPDFPIVAQQIVAQQAGVQLSPIQLSQTHRGQLRMEPIQ